MYLYSVSIVMYKKKKKKYAFVFNHIFISPDLFFYRRLSHLL